MGMDYRNRMAYLWEQSRRSTTVNGQCPVVLEVSGMPGIQGSTHILVHPTGLLEQSELWGGQFCLSTKL
jgi:hypothetical protein